jgi:hypothetical protein
MKLSTIHRPKNTWGFSHTLIATNSSYNFSLFFSVIFLLSLILARNSSHGIFSGLKHKAQAETGPNQGHLPASSIHIFIFIFLDFLYLNFPYNNCI